MSAKGIFSAPSTYDLEERLHRLGDKALNNETTPWIGVDLDGTLAEYNREAELTEIGEPIEPMMDRVRKWLAQGLAVKIFTARAAYPQQVELIKAWLVKNGLPELEVTNIKDFGMVELWDDRCIQVTANTGLPASGERRVRTRISRKRSRDGKRFVSKLLISVGRLTSSWSQVPENEFQPAAVGRTK